MARESKSDKTKQQILDAAAKEFVEKGYNAVTISQIAKRANLSKQLVHHYFPGKVKLFETVHETRFRPPAHWDDEIPAKLEDIVAERFRKRSRNIDYMRVLTWEAASRRMGQLPGERERRHRIDHYAKELALLQAQGKIPRDMDVTMLHLMILALASYPLSFNQVTRLVTGKSGTDPGFTRAWLGFLRKVMRKLLAP